MIFALGIVTGLVVSILILLILVYFRPSIDRTMNTLQSKIKQKGAIIEPESSEIQDWISDLKQE